MNRILRTFGAVLFASSVSLSVAAQSFDDVEGTFSWAVGNESAATASSNVADALSQSTLKVGTDLTTSLNAAYSSLGIAEGTMVLYKPTTSNAGCVEGDRIQYNIKLKKGLTFTPTSVEFDAVKVGTDGASFSWSYSVDGTEGTKTTYDGPTQVRRDNNANTSAPITHTESISGVSGQSFSLNLYISNTANDKKISIGNVKINGVVSGTVVARTFKDFYVDMTSDPMTVKVPSDGVLPSTAELLSGTWHDSQHGYEKAKFKLFVDGPVQITLGGCQFSSTAVIKSGDTVLATLSTGAVACSDSVRYTYNLEAADTLTVDCGPYCPWIRAVACEQLPDYTVTYYNSDGSTIIATETVQGGSTLSLGTYDDQVSVADGYVFRGWFLGKQSTSLKASNQTIVDDNLKLYARTTAKELALNTARYVYDLTKVYFYQEDHECISMSGAYHDAQHGWAFNAGQSIKVDVAGKAYVSLTNCCFSSDAEAVVTDTAGNEVARFATKAETDGEEASFAYDGDATTLTISFSATTYVHKVCVSNVVDFTQFDENTGYVVIAGGDVSSFLIALEQANATGNKKIFLKNGTYDLGETVLTTISGDNISIIGESMDSVIIVNAPPVEQEGIGTTATLYNTSNNLYLQDLTIQNALDYYSSAGSGRAVCLQDKGANTICKNVKMLSYQDTYYSNSASNFYWEDCEIHGTVDYVCGDGNVVYNRCLFVNESRTTKANDGECTIAAPSISTSCEWGYVMMDCRVRTLSKSFNWGRSWNGRSRLAYLNTVVEEPSRIASSRFTTKGMKAVADRFLEYNTLNTSGEVVSPASNILTFTLSSDSKTYETIMTDEQAAQFNIDSIYGDWAPDVTAAQLVAPEATAEAGLYSWEPVDGATAYLVYVDGEIQEIVPASQTSYSSTGVVSLRVANSRGGFGLLFGTEPVSSAVAHVAASSEVVSVEFFNLAGQKVADSVNGLVIEVLTFSDGSKSSRKLIK